MSDFTKSRQISYCDGPVTPGTPEQYKFTTRWAAWVASAGVRVGKYDSITLPANSLGVASGLFPTTKPEHLSIAFDTDTFMHIAIQKDATTIQLKFYTDLVETQESVEWTGLSPMLFNNWLLFYDEVEPDGYDVVCYYLKASLGGSIFARFARDSFATEYTIHSGLPSEIDYLVSTDVYEGLRQIMLAKGTTGLNLTLTSDVYGSRIANSASLEALFDTGVYALRAVSESISGDENAASLTMTFTSGSLAAAKEEDLSSVGQEASLSIAFKQGEYST